MRGFFAALAVVMCLLFASWGVVRIVEGIQFDRNVVGHLKRAADANTIELAEKELAGVVAYLKMTGMTSGYTSVWWTTPDEDVEFWFKNLTASLDELHKVSPVATQLEKSNVLIKLRETLIDHGKGVSVTAPSGASIFPHNMLFWWWGVISFVLACFSLVVATSDVY